jgi:16S rRNA (guanine527-N7)-methyltransferase
MNSPAASSIKSEQISAILQSFDLAASEPLCEQIRTYIDLLLRWNRRISLTAIESPEQIVRSHFAEGLFATKCIPDLHGRLADVGTGAGFPGLPLRMYSPDLHLTLIEPNAKKCAFLAEAVRALELKNVEIIQRRYEDVRMPDPPFDTVTARAVGQFQEFADWAESVLAPSGRLMVWTGPDGKSELERSKSWKWHAPYVIPGSKHRLIVIGSR